MYILCGTEALYPSPRKESNLELSNLHLRFTEIAEAATFNVLERRGKGLAPLEIVSAGIFINLLLSRQEGGWTRWPLGLLAGL